MLSRVIFLGVYVRWSEVCKERKYLDPGGVVNSKNDFGGKINFTHLDKNKKERPRVGRERNINKEREGRKQD